MRLGAMLLLLLLLTATGPAQSTVIIVSDFDNSIVEGRQTNVISGTFQSYFYLFPTDQPKHHIIQKIQRSNKILTVTSNEFFRILPYLRGGQQEGTITSITLQSGEMIRPDDYEIRYQQTLREFLSSDTENFLIKTYRRALKASPPNGYRGPFWDYFILLLSHPESARSVRISTARGHSVREWEEFFQLLLEVEAPKHHLPQLYPPNLKYFANVSLDNFDIYDLDPTHIAQRKVGHLLELAKRLNNSHLDPEKKILAPGGGEQYRPGHFLIFIDDHQENLNLFVEQIRPFVQSRQLHQLKIGIFNTGLDSEVVSSKRPRFAIMTEDGNFRHATELERVGEFPFLADRLPPQPVKKAKPPRKNNKKMIEGEGRCSQHLEFLIP